MQQFIPGAVAQTFIDRGQPVDVDTKERAGLAGAFQPERRDVDGVAQRRGVGQAGHAVVAREALHLDARQ